MADEEKNRLIRYWPIIVTAAAVIVSAVAMDARVNALESKALRIEMLIESVHAIEIDVRVIRQMVEDLRNKRGTNPAEGQKASVQSQTGPKSGISEKS